MYEWHMDRHIDEFLDLLEYIEFNVSRLPNRPVRMDGWDMDIS
jgi:hypothetical protein